MRKRSVRCVRSS